MSFPYLIGIYSPAPRCGKTTLAGLLVRDHGYTCMSFADPLRAVLRTLLQQFNVSDTRIDSYLKNKEEIIPELGVSMRYLLRTFGTEWGRNFVDENIWTNCMQSRITPYDAPAYVVIDDLRFEDEFDFIKRLGGSTWRLSNKRVSVPVRQRWWQKLLGIKPKLHRSDCGLEHRNFDVYVSNDDSIADLSDTLELILYGFDS